MANSLREVKVRISSTQSTAQITKAMYMVSQSKVKKAEKTYKSYKDFMQRISSMISQILAKREVHKTAYFIITSDRGLAGAYNSSIFKALADKIKETHKSNDEFITGAVGKQGFSFLKRMGYPMINDSPVFVRDDVQFVDIEPLAKQFINLYIDKEIDKLVIIYNHYVNSLTQEIKFEELLPMVKVDTEYKNIDYVYESGIEKTVNLILSMYAKDMIYGIILDSKTSEHSARMNSMKSATDNAEEIIGKLQLLYNRARQNVVTTELIDIIGGANAIGGDE